VVQAGQTVKLHAKLFDAQGTLPAERTAATWALQVEGNVGADGSFTVASDPVEQAGTIKATVGAFPASAGARRAAAAVVGNLRSYADGAVPPAGSTPPPASSRSSRSTGRRC
jgi:hypothetical protein